MAVRIVRSMPRRGYASIPNGALRDPRISDRARGLLCRMLSHKDGHGPASAAELAKGTREGRDAISKAQAELEAAGYLERRTVRLPNGRLETEVWIYDTPQNRGGSGESGPEPVPGFQEPVSPAETRVSPGRTGYGFSGTGDDQQERASAQVAPDTGNPEPVSPAETRVSAARTGSGFSGSNQKTREDKTKKISQSAQVREAARYLRGRYGDGLTDDVINHVLVEAQARAARAGRPVYNLARYIAGWSEGDLADVVNAALDAEDPERPDPPGLRVIEDGSAHRRAIDACGRCDHNGLTLDDRPRRCDHGTPAQQPLMVPVPADEPPADAAAAAAAPPGPNAEFLAAKAALTRGRRSG